MLALTTSAPWLRRRVTDRFDGAVECHYLVARLRGKCEVRRAARAATAPDPEERQFAHASNMASALLRARADRAQRSTFRVPRCIIGRVRALIWSMCSPVAAPTIAILGSSYRG
jgi:hypothetical protein